MKKFFHKLRVKIWKHKIYSIISLLVILGAGYFGYQKFFAPKATIRYVTAAVQKGPLVSSISGSGQISVLDQIDIKPKASGQVTKIYVTVGQEVKAGTLLASLDASDALKSVRDAQTNLQSANLSLAKLTQPADELSIMQSENSLEAAKENKQQAEDNLKKNYDDGFNSVSNAFLDLPTVMSGLKDLLYGYNYTDTYSNIDWYANQALFLNHGDNSTYDRVLSYRDDVNTSYQAARVKYDQTFDYYKTLSRDSSSADIENLVSQSYDTVKLISDAIKNANNYLDLVQDLMQNYSVKITIPALMTTHQNSLDSFTSKVNSHLSDLLSSKNSIVDSKNTIISSERTIEEKTASLEELKAGANALDIQSQQLSIKQKENSLLDAQEKLADYSVRAPFDGVVAQINVKKGDDASSGTAAVTLISKQKIATIALNEIDIAKVKVGQKVNLSFDAIEDLSLTGEVAEVDTLGTTSQGVVSYNVKISFDVQDDRIKPGMSVSASIILNRKDDVLMVANSAVKNQGGTNYVEVLVNGQPQRKDVAIGDSNDTMTEITDGLTEGENVITQKISSTAAASNAAQATTRSGNNSFRQGGGVFMMGGH